MSSLEKSLIEDGQRNQKALTFVQIPTAAGRECRDRIFYWQELGRVQADLIGAEPLFIPIFDRDVAKVLLDTPGDSVLVGIDELIAMVRRSGQSQWRVFGEAEVHILKGLPSKQLSHDEEIPFG